MELIIFSFKVRKLTSPIKLGVIEKVSIRLNKVIGEDMNEKQMQLRDEIERTTTLTTTERHKVVCMIMQDNTMVSYFFNVSYYDRDE